MKKKWMIIPVLLLVVVGMVMVGCSNSTSGSTDSGTGTDATWNVAPKDGAAGTATTTAINITFNRAVASLENNKVSVTGDAARTSAALVKVGDGTVWEIPISVTNAGMASVTLAGLTGIVNGTKTADVHKEGETSGITYTATPDGTANTVTSTSIQIVFADEVAGLEATEITFGNAFAVEKGTLLGPGDDGKTYSLGITPASGGATTITITHEGVYSSPVNITIHYKVPGAEDVIPPGGFDAVELGAFNWSNVEDNATKQRGWGPNGLEGVESDVEIEDFIDAQYLWIWTKNNPTGGFNIIWQGDIGTGFGGWVQSDALNGSGAADGTKVTKTQEQGGTVIKIDLAATLGQKESKAYTDAKAGIRFILGYFSPDLTSLGDMKAYLLLPTGTIDGRGDSFTVTFDTTGGTPTTIADVSVLTGYPLGVKYPAAPEKTDFVFDGWENAASESYTKYTLITANTALSAVWLKAYTVTFDFQGGGDDITVIVGEGQALKAADIPTLTEHPTDPNKAFAGWYQEAVCTTAMDTDALISSDTTYYAKWDTSVVITFNLEGGTGAPATLKIPENFSMGDNYPTPTKRGYVFGGWFTAANGSGTEYTKDTTVDASISLYAKWTLIPPFKLELPDKGTENNWLLDKADTYTIENLAKLQAAKYLVLEFTSIANKNGFGGLQIALQGDGNWEWNQYISRDWTDMTDILDYSNPDDFYIVIELASMDVWDSIVMGGTIKIILNSIPGEITFKDAAYLTNIELVMPATDAVDCSKEYTGWGAMEVPEFDDL
jgi:uncharacterized repeat protein (TIGR02543 family)